VPPEKPALAVKFGVGGLGRGGKERWPTGVLFLQL